MSNTKIWLLSLAIVFVGLAFYFLGDVLMQFAIAAMIAYFISPLVTAVEKNCRLPRGVALLLIIVLLLILISLLISIGAPMLYAQAMALISAMPGYTTAMVKAVTNLMDQFKTLDIPPVIMDTITSSIHFSNSNITAILQNAANFFMGLPSQMVTIFIQFLAVIYFVLDGKKMVKAVVSLFSPKTRLIINDIMSASNHMVKVYFKTNVILTFGLAVVTWIILSLFNVEYALLFAVVTFVLDFIPIFGAMIATVIVLLVALFSKGWVVTLWIGILLIVFTQIKNSIIGPRLQSDSQGLHPVVILFALSAGGVIFGPIGVFIAIPIAGFIKILYVKIRAAVQPQLPKESTEEKK